MKQSFVHCAEVMLEPSADSAAPGGAVTIVLCGSWDHPGPCRWPHQTSATWEERRGRVRVVFATEAGDEMNVRALIDRALSGGECVGPDGSLHRWVAKEHTAGILTEEERSLAMSMAGT